MIHKHSAGGIVIHEDKVLTISWTDRDYIAFPKGIIEDGETSETAASREVYEETGYKVRVVAPVKSWSYDFEKNGLAYRKTVDYYLMELVDSEPPTPHREETETFENLWLNIDAARAKLTFDDAKEALDIALVLRDNLSK